MSSPWKQFPQNIPADTDVVYVRPAFPLCTPYQATWDEASSMFKNISVYDQDTSSWVDTGLSIAWIYADKWRPL